MEHSPSWEANRFSASQEIPRNLWNPKVRYRIHERPPSVPILRLINPAHAFPSHFLTIILILFSHLRLGLPSGHFSSGVISKILYAPFLPRIHATCPVHLILFDLIIYYYQYRNKFSIVVSIRFYFVGSLSLFIAMYVFKLSKQEFRVNSR
jgi:hypothetical protein